MSDAILINEKCMGLNPIRLGLSANDINARYFLVYRGEDEDPIYSGMIFGVNGYAYTDLSEIFISASRIAGVNKYRVYSNYGEDVDSIKYVTVYGGGISKLLQRKLAAAGTDIFSWKLKNVNTNFFLTTRTNGRIITIPEDELLPLSYYAQGLSFMIKASGQTLATYDHSGDVDESLQQLDFNALRLQAMTTIGKFISAFDVITSTGGYACTIVITEVETKTDYFLKFRNSWGEFERIAITGVAEFNPEFGETELVDEFDTIIGGFVPSIKQKSISNAYKATIGYKTDAERLFLIDALLSKTIFFVANGLEFAVKVSADSSLFQTTALELVEISISIELLDKDSFFSPLLMDPDNILVSNTNEIVTVNGFKLLI